MSLKLIKYGEIMSHNTIKIHTLLRIYLNHGYMEVQAEEQPSLHRPDNNDGITLIFRPNGLLWESPECHPFMIMENEHHEGEIETVYLDLSAKDADALIELLLNFQSVRESREKRFQQNREIEELTPIQEE